MSPSGNRWSSVLRLPSLLAEISDIAFTAVRKCLIICIKRTFPVGRSYFPLPQIMGPERIF